LQRAADAALDAQGLRAVPAADGEVDAAGRAFEWIRGWIRTFLRALTMSLRPELA
jgi:hypothetical protein